jgi:hypothetical protein
MKMESPKQNWSLANARVQQEHVLWLRSLTPARSMALCEELQHFAAQLRRRTCGNESADQGHWQEKLKVRRKQLAAFKALDQSPSDR